ncbi:MAG: hypothetical protein COA43_02495 [Robiginitomaculum sp.]|nr:MAG: hypothetical protein COA43_02495 [Robiginitomaculum sp.]
MKKIILLAGVAMFTLGACGDANIAGQDENSVALNADGDFAVTLQTALIEAGVNTTIQLPAGHFKLTDGLSLDVEGVTINGAGEGKTILDFSGQKGAGEGLLVTSNNVTLSNFTMRDTAGDGIKSKNANGIVYRDLTVEWTGEPNESNGAYAVYPVSSKNILIDNVTVRGASDAGIYVGQSSNIIIRNSLAEYNVAGIEIENSSYADVHGNTARHNTGGILVFDLPDLPVMGGKSTRVFDNDIYKNNTPNFAPVGNIVANIPSGTGVMIMANENVHVFENRFANNQTVQVLVSAYIEDIKDETYNPLPRNIAIYDNTYSGGGDNPQGMLEDLAVFFGGKLPEIVWDGVTSWNDHAPIDVNMVVNEADNIGYVSIGIGSYPVDEANIKPSPIRPKGTMHTQPSPVKLPQEQ